MAIPGNRMEKMLFNNQTTYRSDYRTGEVGPLVVTKYKEKPKNTKRPPPVVKDVHTLNPWIKPVPFNLLHRPRPITGENPNKVQQPYVKQEDAEKEKAIKTRPRVVMTPAVRLDDIEDRQARQILCDSMYTSNMTRGSREVSSDYFSVKAPLPGLPAPANPIKLPPSRLPYVSPEWRMETLSWEKQQLRTYCDSTKEFWLRKEPSFCPACKQSEIVEADRKRRYQMEVGRRG